MDRNAASAAKHTSAARDRRREAASDRAPQIGCAILRVKIVPADSSNREPGTSANRNPVPATKPITHAG